MDQRTQRYLVEEELEQYRDGWITRREFVRRAGLLGVGMSVATALARNITPISRAGAAPLTQGTSPYSVPEGDPSVATDWVWYLSTDGVMVKAYVAWPAGASMNQSLPGAAVCHENQGLNPHTEDVARRLAKAGYVAIAPDLISRVGPPTRELSDPSDIRLAYRDLDDRQNARDFSAALDYLAAHPAVNEHQLAATGYCFGGGVIWELATIAPRLRAAAPFYGDNPPLEEVPNIRAAVFGVYGELDTRLNAGISDLEPALQAAGVTYRIQIYPNSRHAFHADFRPDYNPETAPRAWEDTLSWFAEHLGLPSSSR
jgi:carboxymethylenebutenolidase